MARKCASRGLASNTALPLSPWSPSFVRFARQLDDGLLLQRRRERLQLGDALEIGACFWHSRNQCVRPAARLSVASGSTSLATWLSQPKSSGAGTRYSPPRGVVAVFMMVSGRQRAAAWQCGSAQADQRSRVVIEDLREQANP